MNLLVRLVRSSLGSKYLMALTGLALIGFVVAHMVGNLLIYAGPDAINTYAQALKARPALLWAARLGLLTVFLLHLSFGLRLWIQNRSARPQRYVYEETVQASWASRHMALTGLVLLAFVTYHLAHFTLGVVKPANLQYAAGKVVELPTPRNYLDLAEVRIGTSTGDRYQAVPNQTLKDVQESGQDARHDVYSMVLAGFRNPWVTASYLVAMLFLALHLWHGGTSMFQSLGLAQTNKLAIYFGPVLALVVLVGNCSIPLAVWFGVVGRG